jgi:hypothetical protein
MEVRIAVIRLDGSTWTRELILFIGIERAGCTGTLIPDETRDHTLTFGRTATEYEAEPDDDV